MLGTLILGTFAETKVPRRAGAKPGIKKIQNEYVYGEEYYQD